MPALARAAVVLLLLAGCLGPPDQPAYVTSGHLDAAGLEVRFADGQSCRIRPGGERWDTGWTRERGLCPRLLSVSVNILDRAPAERPLIAAEYAPLTVDPAVATHVEAAVVPAYGGLVLMLSSLR